ncbi:hypothetical protein ACLB2K_001110 [Fragaria x ananassa]
MHEHQNSCHELRLPTSLMGLGVDAYEPTPVPSLPSDITAVTAGHYHSLAVTSQGQLWAWGRDLEAQLGRGAPSPRDSWNEPRRATGLDRVNVCSAFASGVISAAIGDDGSLWVWGKSKRGQLGLGEQVMEAVVPSRDEALAGEKITKVRSCLRVVSGDGTRLSCGSNVYQLGRDKQDVGLLPVDISFRPMSIAARLGHSLEICQVPSSDVMGGATGIITWGWNQTSQLGRGGPENIPLGVQGLEGETPVSVSGGRVHSIALTSKREVWVCGSGKNVRLKLGSSCDEPEPIVLDSVEGCEVSQVVSGFDHNLVLTAE